MVLPVLEPAWAPHSTLPRLPALRGPVVPKDFLYRVFCLGAPESYLVLQITPYFLNFGIELPKFEKGLALLTLSTILLSLISSDREADKAIACSPLLL